jgi:putative ATP-binding cassette transporter
MNFIRKHSKKYALFISLGILTAASSSGVLLIINKMISRLIGKQTLPTLEYLFYFAGALALFFLFRLVMSISIINFTQVILKSTRLDIVKMVLRSSYHPLLKNKERIYTALTRDTGNIVNASVGGVDLFTNAIIVVFCCVYMGILSLKLLLLTLLLIGCTLLIYIVSEKKANALLDKAMTHEDKFVRYLNEILGGFKEIIISRKKGVEILDRRMMEPLVTGMRFQKQFLMQFLHNRIMGQLAFYIFIGVVLFLLRTALKIDTEVLVSYIFLLLYMWGPIETVVVLIPGFEQARTSWKRLRELSIELEEKGLEIYHNESFTNFRELRLQNIFYEYGAQVDEKPFSVGPTDFSVKAGEIVFIYGGNGSGKTTFVNLITGLFLSTQGEVGINDENFTGSPTLYRSLFSVVFSDFHLFDELYGVENVDVSKVKEYLELFELDGKVDFVDNKFTELNLSTGQRKRLALIYAMVERKPILVLDEFAAEQDPHFRRKFYCEILGYLKKNGFTVIAVTHDNLYYEYCDSLYSMDYGRLSMADVSSQHKQMTEMPPRYAFDMNQL